MPRLYVVPSGLEKLIDYLNTKYNKKPIFVTENGKYIILENYVQNLEQTRKLEMLMSI